MLARCFFLALLAFPLLAREPTETLVLPCGQIVSFYAAETPDGWSNVTIQRGHQKEGFRWSKRTLAEIFDPREGFYPEDVFLALEGKRVLDAGCGKGAFVDGLRADRPVLPGTALRPANLYLSGPVEAYGIDIYLDPEHRAKDYFQLAEMSAIPYPDEFFDEIFVTWSVFSYGEPEDYRRELTELQRVLRRGGRLHFGPIEYAQGLHYGDLMPTLRIKRMPQSRLRLPSATFERASSL